LKESLVADVTNRHPSKAASLMFPVFKSAQVSVEQYFAHRHPLSLLLEAIDKLLEEPTELELPEVSGMLLDEASVVADDDKVPLELLVVDVSVPVSPTTNQNPHASYPASEGVKVHL